MTYYGSEIIAAAKCELKKFIKHESEELYSLMQTPQADLTKVDEMSIIEMAKMADELEEKYYSALGRNKK